MTSMVLSSWDLLSKAALDFHEVMLTRLAIVKYVHWKSKRIIDIQNEYRMKTEWIERIERIRCEIHQMQRNLSRTSCNSVVPQLHHSVGRWRLFRCVQRGRQRDLSWSRSCSRFFKDESVWSHPDPSGSIRFYLLWHLSLSECLSDTQEYLVSWISRCFEYLKNS